MTYRNLSPTAISAITAEDSDEVWLILLVIRHPSLAEPIRVVRNNEDIQSTADGSLKTYQAVLFRIELPGEDAEEPGSAVISLPNVDLSLMEAIRTIQGPAEVDIYVVLASQPNVVEMDFYGMVLRELDWDASRISGRLRFETIVTEPLSVTITPARFPGLF